MRKINIDKQTNFDIMIVLSIVLLPIFGALLNLLFVTSSDYKLNALKNLASVVYLFFYIGIIIFLIS